MKKILLLAVLFFSVGIIYSQPQKISYQAIIRDANGNVLQNQNVTLQLDILQGSSTGSVIYSETQTTTTNQYGLINIFIGDGIPTQGVFSDIDWSNGPYFLKTSVDIGNGPEELGTQELVSVPYSLYSQSAKYADSISAVGNSGELQFNNNGNLDASPNLYWDITKERLGIGTSSPQGRVVIQQDPLAPDSLPLFEVKDKNGDPVFVVYPDSVHVFLPLDSNKAIGSRGGFAVSGRVNMKGAGRPYLYVTSDSTRIYFEEDNSKAIGSRGGFAVSGRVNMKSGSENDYFAVSPNSTVNVINPSEPRVFWYPNKEAFLTGRVLIESPDSVGTNSFVTGFESKAIGDYSQALGYRAVARGNYSMAIGDSAEALGIYSFAIGGPGELFNYNTFSYEHVGAPKATFSYSYAFGAGCVSSNSGSVSIGALDTSSGMNSLAMGYQTIASGEYSTSMGALSKSSGLASIAMNWETEASGDNSVAMGDMTIASGDAAVATGYRSISSGYNTVAMGMNVISNGYASIAMGEASTSSGEATVSMGYGSIASTYGSIAMGAYAFATGECSVALGNSTEASGKSSTVMGYGTRARGKYSFAAGYTTVARSYLETVFGAFNDTTASTDSANWVDTDPLFVIGNGYYGPHNAVTVLKNGNVGINTNTPDKLLTVNGDARVTGDIYYGAIGSSTTYSKPDFVFKPGYKKDFSIDYIERYIKRHGHLPWVTAAKDEKDGINMTRMSFQTLEAVENIQMQVIALRKENLSLKKENQELLKRIEKIEKQLKNK